MDISRPRERIKNIMLFFVDTFDKDADKALAEQIAVTIVTVALMNLSKIKDDESNQIVKDALTVIANTANLDITYWNPDMVLISTLSSEEEEGTSERTADLIGQILDNYPTKFDADIKAKILGNSMIAMAEYFTYLKGEESNQDIIDKYEFIENGLKEGRSWWDPNS